MTWLTILWIAVGLGMDAFAVAIAVGARRRAISPRPLFRQSFHFGLFQFMMPVIGWYLGTTIDDYIRDYDHWIAFGLLTLIGVKMIRESVSVHRKSKTFNNPTRGWTLVMLSIATSIDALAVGLSMAFLGIEIWIPSLIIGIVAAEMTAIGMIFVKIVGVRCGRSM